ncbi:MAG: CAP domain-containing protein [Solirubrobacteraceae bacterium]
MAADLPIPVSTPSLPGAVVAPLKAATAHCRGARARHARKATLRRALRCVINQQRARNGLTPLAANRRLTRAAGRHASDMARHNYFSHVSLSGTDPLRRVRAAGWRRGVGETLAWGCGPQSSPAAIVAAWLASPPHRAIILGHGRVVGIGYKRGPGCSGGRAFVVAEVG